MSMLKQRGCKLSERNPDVTLYDSNIWKDQAFQATHNRRDWGFGTDKNKFTFQAEIFETLAVSIFWDLGDFSLLNQRTQLVKT